MLALRCINFGRPLLTGFLGIVCICGYTSLAAADGGGSPAVGATGQLAYGQAYINLASGPGNPIDVLNDNAPGITLTQTQTIGNLFVNGLGLNTFTSTFVLGVGAQTP